MAFRLTLLTVALGLACTATAQLVITQLGTPTVIDFQSDIPGVYVTPTGFGVTSIAEPNAPILDVNFPGIPNTSFASSGRYSAVISTGVSFFHPNNGPIPTLFAADGNSNGTTTDNSISFGTMKVLGPTGNEADLQLTSRALRLSPNNDGIQNAVFFRIQNNTGQTVNSWIFTADIFFREPEAGDSSSVELSYAANNGINPGTMTFNFIATSPSSSSTQNPVLSLAHSFNETVNVSVANGDYIVLRFRDTQGQAGSGSTIFIDNIGVIAVPEPSTYLLIGLGLAGLCALRRFSAKSS
jgi:hypothetical protein